MLLSHISVVGSLHLLGIMLVSMLIGAGLMSLRQWCVGNRLRQFHRKYGAGYMTPDIDADSSSNRARRHRRVIL